MKTCTKCNQTKSKTHFYKESRQKDGLQRWCKDCKRGLSNKYYHDRSDIITERSRNKYATCEATRQRHAAYKRKNRAYYTALQNMRYVLQKECTPDLSQLERSMIEGLYLISQILSNSCGEQYHVDHIYPLSKGGLHCWDNLQVIPASENLRKHAKLPQDQHQDCTYDQE